MLPRFWVASRRRRLVGATVSSQSAHSDEARLESLGEEEVVLWRRVIAGQGSARIARRGTKQVPTV
jgi:hypothetical protein